MKSDIGTELRLELNFRYVGLFISLIFNSWKILYNIVRKYLQKDSNSSTTFMLDFIRSMSLIRE